MSVKKEKGLKCQWRAEEMLWLLNCSLPGPLPFFSLCIYKLWMVTSSCMQHHDPSSHLLREVFFHSTISVSQVLSTWILKPATKGCLSFVKHNKWSTKSGTRKWTGGWVTGEQTAHTILMSYDEASHILDLRLHRYWLVLTEHLPGEAIAWPQGSLRKQREDSHERKPLASSLRYKFL